MNRTPLAHIVILIAFLLNSLGPITSVRADELVLPRPGTMMKISPNFRPPLMQGLKIDRHNPFHLQFMMEEGQGSLRDEETLRSLRYFLAALTVPEKDIWVNLSPHENNRIIPPVLSNTEMGVDLLGQDYILKQLSSSLIYPDGAQGREFWRSVYARAKEVLGTTNIPLNTVNKVWITPGEILVQEKGDMAIINKATLRVMIESDYLALKLNKTNPASKDQALMNDAYRRVVIPELTREVNSGVDFSRVRQIYHTLILAAWYKRHFHQGALASSYVDMKKTAGVSIEDKHRYQRIYERYLKAYRKGVFNFIREEPDTLGDITARKYFSGGCDIGPQIARRYQSIPFDQASAPVFSGRLRAIDVRIDKAQLASEYIVDKTKKENLKEMGNKGRNLQENDRLLTGHIPPFEILSASLYDDYRSGKITLQEVAQAVRERFSGILGNGGSLVVRPSSTINMPGVLPTDKKVTTVDQIVEAILKIYRTWEEPDTQAYLETNEADKMFGALVKMNIFNNKKIAKKTGPAIVIQKEILGDLNEQSGSGVFITRNTKTGKFLLSGSFGVKTPPEDIRNGVQSNSWKRISPEMYEELPYFKTMESAGLYESLRGMADKLERHYGYPVEVEFVVENGKLYIVQVNQQYIPANMRLTVATDMADEGKIIRSTIPFPDRNAIRMIGQIKPDAKIQVATQAFGLSVGAADGYLAFSLDKVKELRNQGHAVIYVSTQANEKGLLQMLVSNEIDGLITFYGDYFMHTARIAQEQYIPAVSLANQEAQLVGNVVKALIVGNNRFKEGERIVVNATDDEQKGNDIIHRGQLILPLQEGPVIENIRQVPVGHLYFDVDTLQEQIMEKYKGTDYTILTATHALLKAYLMRNKIKGKEANKLESAANAIHMLFGSKHFKGQGKDGGREDVWMPITRSFGEKFPFPDIKSVDDIPKAVELMGQFVKRYRDMAPMRVDYLNYPPESPIIIPANGDIPLEFSIILSTENVNWQYENPQLWAFVRGIDMTLTTTIGGVKNHVMPAEMLADPFSLEKIRVLGKINAQRFLSIEKTGEAKIKIGLIDGGAQGDVYELPQQYFVQIKDFREYIRHRISQAIEKNYPASKTKGLTVKKVMSLFPMASSQEQRMGVVDMITGNERMILDNGGFLWRPFKQVGTPYTAVSDLNPNKLWAHESDILVKIIRKLFPDINIIHQEKKIKDVPSSLQGHNMPTMYVDTYASYILFDKDAVQKLSTAVADFSKGHDLGAMFIKDERENRLDLEGVIMRLYIDRFGEDGLTKLATDPAQVGGIDLNLSGRSIGSRGSDVKFPVWTKESLDQIKGFIPTIIKQRNISTVMEFIGSHADASL